MYVDILKILARCGPMNFARIMYEVNICGMFLKQDLDLLISHSLVKKELLHKKRIYAITERGITALECFRKLNNTLQILEETSKIPAL